MGLTREEAFAELSICEIVEGMWAIGYYLTPTRELIDQIYDDHEAQIKAVVLQKDEEIEQLKVKLTLCDRAYEKAKEMLEDKNSIASKAYGTRTIL